MHELSNVLRAIRRTAKLSCEWDIVIAGRTIRDTGRCGITLPFVRERHVNIVTLVMVQIQHGTAMACIKYCLLQIYESMEERIRFNIP